LVAANIGQDHMMYVADLTPPSDPEDTVKMVSACDAFHCNFQPSLDKTISVEELSKDPLSLTSNPDKDLSVVESLSGSRRKKRSKTHLLDDTLVGSPYEAVFRSLRLNTDYSIKISFVMAGHTLGVVDFTIAGEDRRLSTSTASSGFSSRKVSSASSCPPEEEEDPDSPVTTVKSDKHLEDLLQGVGETQLVVVSLGAAWCPVCHRQRPELERLSREFPEVSVLSVDVDSVAGARDMFAVVALPTIVLQRGGRNLERLMGSQAQGLRRSLEQHLRPEEENSCGWGNKGQ